MGRAALALLAAACLAALAGGGARLAGAAGPLAEGARATVDTVSDSCLNVRAEPALAAPVLACLPEGTGVAARGRRAEADGYEWEAVRAGGALEGWAAAGFLARPGDPSGAPDIGAPPERGLALIAWPGGPLEGLAGAVAARGGCALRAAWGNGPDGGIVRYRFGASDAVNRAFLDARGGVPPAGTLLLLVCAGEALAQPPPAPPPPRAALRYGPLDATGEAATPGSYAFLDADGEAIPSWARLRNAATLRVHRTDADGEDRAALYGGAAAGDLVVEGRTADDCWIRFRATAAPATPPPGSARWEFPVEWTAYARAGCADAARAGAGAAVAWGAPPDLRTADIASPVRHGPWLLVPTDWEGLPAARSGRALRLAGEAVEPQSPEAAAAPYPPAETADPDEARRLIPLWRDPALPEGWTLAGAEIGTRNAPPLGYRARYADAQGRTALQIEARPSSGGPTTSGSPAAAARPSPRRARSTDAPPSCATARAARRTTPISACSCGSSTRRRASSTRCAATTPACAAATPAPRSPSRAASTSCPPPPRTPRSATTASTPTARSLWRAAGRSSARTGPCSPPGRRCAPRPRPCASTRPTPTARRRPPPTAASRAATSSSGARPTTAGCATSSPPPRRAPPPAPCAGSSRSSG